MFPVKDQLIQVRFNNGVYFDAIVETWTDQKSVLRLPDSEDKVIIQKTLQDVLLVKIIANKQIKNIANDSENISDKFEELKEYPKNENNLKQMSELKDELNKLERDEIRKKLTSHEATGARQINYGIPRNLQVSGAAQHTSQKTSTTDSEFNSELQILFSKKH